MKLRKLLLASAIVALFATCDRTGDSYIVGDVFTDNKAVLGYVDTFSLQLSTIRLDSFVTSGLNDIYTGYFKDDKAGNVLPETYVPLAFSKKTNIPEGSVYDSLVICFKPNSSWIGDTLLPKELKIYEVKEEIRPDYFAFQQFMFNNQKIKRSDALLATVTIDPMPYRALVSSARMTDSLGQIWFKKVIENDDIMDNNEYFEQYFHGICIVPQTTNVNWGLGFVCNSGSVPASRELEDACQFEIRLYYRRPGDGEDDSYMTFVPKLGGYQYNHFVNDRSGTAFENLEIDGGKVMSYESNNMAYIQTGSGLALRIDFPTISRLHAAAEYMNVLDSWLIIRPKEGSYNEDYKLPSELFLAVTDESNDLYAGLTTLQGNIVSSPVHYSSEDGRPYYLFSVLKFVRSKLMKPTEDMNSLIVYPSNAENSALFKRVVVDDNSKFGEDVQLQVYYITY